MAEEILSMAVLEALPGKEEELLGTLRELYTLMNAKGYSRDSLYRDSAQPEPLPAPAPLDLARDARRSPG